MTDRMNVRWLNEVTGEIKERSMSGIDRSWSPHMPGDLMEDEWEISPLEMACDLVPDLEVAIDCVRMKGMDVEITIQAVERKGTK